MAFSDPYDPRVAFDDVMGGAPRHDLRSAAAVMARRAQSANLRAPLCVQDSADDPTHHTFGTGTYQMLGDEETGLPIFDDLRSRFANALPASKYVRVDTPESYSEFRDARRKPYLEALEARLATLEDAFVKHLVVDHHMVLGDAVVRACGDAVCGGQKVPLPLPDWAQGRIASWQDGPELLCTVQFGGRFVTTGEPMGKYLDQVIDAADAEGVEPEELMALGPPLAQVIGCGTLVGQVCGAAQRLLAGRIPYVGVLSSAADPTTAAAMALLQRCQHGERNACIEAIRISDSKHRRVLDDARERLIHGQQRKARRVS